MKTRKKISIVSLSLILFSLGLIGCKKESILQSKSSSLYVVTDGRLHFTNSANMMRYLEDLSLLSVDKKINELRRLKVKTLDVIFDDVFQAETENQKLIYGMMDPNLGLSEYEALGVFYEHTNLFNEKVEKGTIIKTLENDGWGMELAIKNPGFTAVLNEDGEVLVADTLYKFIGTKLVFKKYPSLEVLSEINFSSLEKATNTWTRHLNGGAWVYDGSNKRFKASVIGTSAANTDGVYGGILNTAFYVDSRAENRVLGSWGGRSSYMPIYSFYINWSYSYQAKQCTFCPNISNPFDLGSANTSPFSWHSSSDPNGQTNLLVRYFKPHGMYGFPNDWMISAPVSVTFNSTIVFSGGSSGYTYNI